AGPVAIPPLRLSPAQHPAAYGGDSDESGEDYSDDEDFIEEELEGERETSDLRERPGPAARVALGNFSQGVPGDFQDGFMTARGPREADGPVVTRGRAAPNFPARPGSPEPPIHSPVPSPGRGRGKGAGSGG
ncbi:unnamed protein product, partial [Polarella glacialis]